MRSARELGRPASPSRGLEARRGLRRSRGLVERRKACGCIAEASEAVRAQTRASSEGRAPPQLPAYLLVKETDLSRTSFAGRLRWSLHHGTLK